MGSESFISEILFSQVFRFCLISMFVVYMSLAQVLKFSFVTLVQFFFFLNFLIFCAQILIQDWFL